MYVIEMDKEMILNDSWILNKISLVVKFKRVVIQRTYVGTWTMFNYLQTDNIATRRDMRNVQLRTNRQHCMLKHKQN